jgi:hypothetical protein
MKHLSSLVLSGILATASVCATASPSDRAAVTVDVPVAEAAIARRFGPSEKGRIVLNGNFPDASYRLGPCQITIDANTHRIEVRQSAYRDLTFGLQVLMPYQNVVEVGPLEAGEYQVVDAVSGSDLVRFVVK